MAYADQEMSSSRMVSIVIVVAIHAFLGYALVTGLAHSAVKKVAEQLEMIDVKEDEPPPEEEPPPPPPPEKRIEPPPVVSPPPIVTTPAPPPQVVTVPKPVITPPPPAITPPPPPPSRAKKAAPKGRTSRWAQRAQNSYPSRAIREERTGTVGFRLTIGANGRPTGCTITRSSGHADLDKSACKVMQRVARFTPALDAAGNPTSGSWGSRVVYRLDN